MPKTKLPKEDWEKEFDERFEKPCVCERTCVFHSPHIYKDFIRHLLSQSQAQAEKRGYERGIVHFVEDKPTKGRIAEIRQEERQKCKKEKKNMLKIIKKTEERYFKEK